MEQGKEGISMVNILVETPKDGENVLKRSFEGVTNQQLKSLFGKYSRQHSRFASKSQSQAQILDESKAEANGTVTSALDAAWLKFEFGKLTVDDFRQSRLLIKLRSRI
jgi:uncharacterized protein (TIGR02284 family)